MRKNNQKIPVGLVLMPILFVILIVIISQQKIIKTSTDTKIVDRNTTEELDNVDTDKEVVSLAVDPNRCRGCGKCTQIDPEHFRLNGKVAEVISQENLSSKALLLAISACKDRAINLN